MPSSVAGLLATALLQIYLMLVTFSFVPFLHLPVSRQSALAGFAAVSLTSWVLVRWRPARWLLPLIAGAAFIVLSYRWPQLWWGLYLLRRQLRWLAVQAAGGAVTQMPPLAGTFLLAAGALAGTALAYAWVARGRPRSVVFLGSMAFLFQWLFYFDEADRWFWLTAPVGFTWLALEEGRRLALAAGAHPTAPHRLAYLGATAGSLLLAAGVARALPADLPAAPLGGVGASLSRALPLLATLRGASGVLPLPPGPFTLATTGFTNSDLELGGTVQPNDGVALRVRVRGTDVPDVLYLRGAARDVYTGRGWTQSDPTVLRLQEPRLSRYLPPPGAELVTLEVEVTGLTTTSVFHLLAPAYLRAPFAESYLDQLGNLTAPTPLPPGTRYTVTSWLPETASRVDRQGTSPTADPPPALPGGVEPPARVRDLARKVAGRARTPLEKARAVEAYLRAIPYSLDCPVTPPGRDFVDYFLFDLQKGYCTYYSTAMATMLRSLGIPTRWVTGFRVDLRLRRAELAAQAAAAGAAAGGTPTPAPAPDEAIPVRNSDAHAWVEAWIPPYGWLTFDPTPAPADLAQTQAAASVPQAPPPNETPNPQAPQAGADAAAPPATGTGAAATAATVARSVGHHLPVLAALAVALLAVLAGRAAWRETRLPRHPDSAAETLFARLERLGRRYGLPRRPAETPREYARRFAALAPGADVTAGVVVAALEVARYAPRPVTSGDLAAAVRAWERLNAQLAARAGRLRHTWRRWML